MAHESYLDIRNQTIIKANSLIQKSRFDLTLLQQKIVLYLISHIQPNDDDFKLYEFEISEFCRVCGIEETSGGNYAMIKEQIKQIADKSLWVKLPSGSETLIRWIEKPYINKKSGTIAIKLDRDMKPFLLQLKDNFTKYELIWTLHFRSKYSIRLYELVKSLHYHDLVPYEREFELEELKKLIGAEGYTTYQTFKARALEPAIKEINEYSDKQVVYKTINKGRKVIGIKLHIQSKDSIEALRIKDGIQKEMGVNDPSKLEDLMEAGWIK